MGSAGWSAETVGSPASAGSGDDRGSEVEELEEAVHTEELAGIHEEAWVPEPSPDASVVVGPVQSDAIVQLDGDEGLHDVELPPEPTDTPIVAGPLERAWVGPDDRGYFHDAGNPVAVLRIPRGQPRANNISGRCYRHPGCTWIDNLRHDPGDDALKRWSRDCELDRTQPGVRQELWRDAHKGLMLTYKVR